MACEAAGEDVGEGEGAGPGPASSGSAAGHLPDMLLLITGRGPQRAHYLKVKAEGRPHRVPRDRVPWGRGQALQHALTAA
jgi:hypothetical protein